MTTMVRSNIKLIQRVSEMRLTFIMVIGFLVFLFVVQAFRSLGIEAEAFDFIGRFATGYFAATLVSKVIDE